MLAARNHASYGFVRPFSGAAPFVRNWPVSVIGLIEGAATQMAPFESTSASRRSVFSPRYPGWAVPVLLERVRGEFMRSSLDTADTADFAVARFLTNMVRTRRATVLFKYSRRFAGR